LSDYLFPTKVFNLTIIPCGGAIPGLAVTMTYIAIFDMWVLSDPVGAGGGQSGRGRHVTDYAWDQVPTVNLLTVVAVLPPGGACDTPRPRGDVRQASHQETR
jgi:hypothetical protein